MATTFTSEKEFNPGDLVHDQIVEIDGRFHAAYVRVLGVVSRRVDELPDWMPLDCQGAKNYPVTVTEYSCEVLRSRESVPPGVSNCLGEHLVSE